MVNGGLVEWAQRNHAECAEGTYQSESMKDGLYHYHVNYTNNTHTSTVTCILATGSLSKHMNFALSPTCERRWCFGLRRQR